MTAHSMLTDKPIKALIFFSLPILAGNLLQQFYSLIDAAIVGNFVSANALGSVGSTGPIVFMITCVSFGLANGASILIGQSFGANGSKGIKPLAITSLIYSLAVGAILSIITAPSAKFLVKLIKTPADLAADSTSYLQIYFMGLIFVFGFNMISAIFRSMGDSKTPLIFLGIASIANIVLDLLFVIVFKMGVSGAAIATVISQALAFMLQILLLSKRLKGYSTPEKSFNIKVLKTLTMLALPTTSQEILISVGVFVTQILTNGFGANVVSGYTATVKITDLALLPMINLGIGMTVFTAQNVGAGNFKRVKEAYSSMLKITIGFGALMAVIVLLFPRELMSIFLGSNITPEIFEAGKSYLMVSSVSFIFMGILFPAESLLKGAGDVNMFMVIATIGAAMKVVGALILIPFFGYYGIWLGMALGWLAEAILTIWRYSSNKWQAKKLKNL